MSGWFYFFSAMQTWQLLAATAFGRSTSQAEIIGCRVTPIRAASRSRESTTKTKMLILPLLPVDSLCCGQIKAAHDVLNALVKLLVEIFSFHAHTDDLKSGLILRVRNRS